MSFQQGLSGLNASSKNLEIIGNNIANANTFGAKSARAEFSDMYASSLNGAKGNQAGIGVNLRTVAQQFTQGALTTTSNDRDLAINGQGFFQVLNKSGEINYTRNGQFKVDRDGFLVNNDGMPLLVQPWDAASGRADGDAAPLQFQTGLGQVLATGASTDAAFTGVKVSMNLKATDAIKDPADLDVTKPATYNYSTSQTMYDSQGASLSMTYYFVKSDQNTWNIYGYMPGVLADGTSAELPFNGEGNDALLVTLHFDNDGVLLPADGTPPGAEFPATAVDANGEIQILDPRGTDNWLVDPATGPLLTVPFDFSDTTQFAAGYSISELKQDGHAAGALNGFTFTERGEINATYSNGMTEILGVVQLANFTNVQGLQGLGGNLWSAGYNAGEITLASPGTGTFGSLQPGALEESNVDLTSELVNMITAQRIYQANAQTIKAQDQVLQTLVNLR